MPDVGHSSRPDDRQQGGLARTVRAEHDPALAGPDGPVERAEDGASGAPNLEAAKRDDRVGVGHRIEDGAALGGGGGVTSGVGVGFGFGVGVGSGVAVGGGSVGGGSLGGTDGSSDGSTDGDADGTRRRTGDRGRAGPDRRGDRERRDDAGRIRGGHDDSTTAPGWAGRSCPPTSAPQELPYGRNAPL